MKKAIIISVTILLCAAAWLVRLPPRQPESTPAPDPVQHTAQAADSIREDFLLIAEDGYLNLYRRGEGAALILSERLDLALFPQNDALQLTRGITFDGEEAAFSAFEDYIG